MMSQWPDPATEDAWAAYWNDEATVWDSAPGGSVSGELERVAWLDALTEQLPPAPADVVDVGTGTGEMALLLANLGHRVTGVDFAEHMLRRARDKARSVSSSPSFADGDGADPPIRFVHGDAADPPIPSGSMDAVINRWVLWALPDPERALSAWRRLLRPAGRLVVFDSWWWGREWIEDPGYRPMLTSGSEVSGDHSMPDDLQLPIKDVRSVVEIEELATTAGFVDVAVERLPRVEMAWRNAHTGSIMDGLPIHVLSARTPTPSGSTPRR